MPAFEAFAKRATIFPEASSCASWTAPGVASLLTGLLPSHHGVQGVHDAPALVPSVPTVAEAFRAAGWWTGASTAGGWVSAANGASRGFDTFSESFDRDGAEASIKALLSARPKEKPFFLFLHTYAAHDPYGEVKEARDVPAAIAEEAERMGKAVDENGGALPPGAARRMMLAFFTDVVRRKAFGVALGKRDWARIWSRASEWIDGGYASEPTKEADEKTIREAYWKGVSWCDRVLSRTLAALAPLPEGTAIVVCSDHGEAFGEHGILGHGRRVDDELIRIPLVVKAPGWLDAEITGGSYSLLDVAPTCFELAGIPEPKGLDGRSLISPKFVGQPPPGRPVRAEATPAPGRTFTSIRTVNWKAVVERENGQIVRTSVFDLSADPGERTPTERAPDDPEFVRAVEEARSGR